MTQISQSASADMVGSGRVFLLPGSLSSGLTGAFFLGAGSTQGLRNYAPGGASLVAAVGSPTWNTGYVSLTRQNYITTAVKNSVSQTIVTVVRAAGPFDATHNVIFLGNFGPDPTNSAASFGDNLQITNNTTAPAATVLWRCYYVNSGSPPTYSLAGQNATLNDADESVFHYIRVKNDNSAKAFSIENVTAGSGVINGVNVTALTRVANATSPFWLGAYPAGTATGTGTFDMALTLFYNRFLTVQEDASLYAILKSFLSGKYSISV